MQSKHFFNASEDAAQEDNHIHNQQLPESCLYRLYILGAKHGIMKLIKRQ